MHLDQSLVWSVLVAIAVLGMGWGIYTSKARGAQHQIEELKRELTQIEGELRSHLNGGLEVWNLLGRLDERTENMDKRMERIETALNGGNR